MFDAHRSPRPSSTTNHSGVEMGPKPEEVASSTPAERTEAARSQTTTTGSSQRFRDWVRTSVATIGEPSAARSPGLEALRGEIERCGAENLPATIEVVREAELACIAMLTNLNRRMQDERRQTGSDAGRQVVSFAVHAENAARWGRKINWLQDVRLYLERTRQGTAQFGHRRGYEQL